MIRFVLLIIIMFFLENIFSQDTIKNGKDFIILLDGKVLEKHFNETKNIIKIVYVYDKSGILVRRYWYDGKGRLLSTTID